MILGLHHQLYPNELINGSLAWDGFQVTFMELSRMNMALFMGFYSNMAILKFGAKANMIIIISMHVYPLTTSHLGL